MAAIALSTILLMTLIGYRRELGHLVMSFGSSIAGDEQKGGAGPAPEAHPETGSVTPNAGSEASPTAKPASMTQGLKTPNESGAEGVPSSNEQVTHPVDAPAGTAQHNATQQGATEDVPSLWTAVENGDTHAEVTLTGRYVGGDAVPQSCAQARVLLEAAVKRGNAEAKQKLDELPQAGCP